MASTRNKNTPGNYCMEMKQYNNSEEWNLYKYSSHGYAYDTKLPGNGFGNIRLPYDSMSYNAIDTESFLYGINSTNLVNPVKEFTPEPKFLETKNLVKRRDIVMPVPLAVSKHERPFLW
jgi:hypothetical protein